MWFLSRSKSCRRGDLRRRDWRASRNLEKNSILFLDFHRQRSKVKWEKNVFFFVRKDDYFGVVASEEIFFSFIRALSGMKIDIFVEQVGWNSKTL